MKIAATGGRRLRARGFTLIELLVVLVIIGMLAAISLPALKNVRQSNTMVSAGRQLVDIFALARAKAIGERTIVHVVFIPSEILGMNFPGTSKADKLGERLKSGVYTTYALVAERTVGDQPGRARFRYLTSWRSLPDGVFISTNKIWDNPILRNTASDTNRPMEFYRTLDKAVYGFPFPDADAKPPLDNVAWPRITFDSRGQLVCFRNGVKVIEDEVIPLARGSILYSRDANGALLEIDVRESPPNNSVETYHRVRIDGLTGRARVETPPILP